MSSSSSSLEDCPFCNIAARYPAENLQHPRPGHGPSKNQSAHVLLSTASVVAFLDHAPMTRGHTLVISRQHREKVSDLKTQESQSLGAWLPVLSRATMRALQSPALESDTGLTSSQQNYGDWNIVQNNGPMAAQVVPHVHFHIIPRTGPHASSPAKSWTTFGRGPRQDLDDDDAAKLIKQMRTALGHELDLLKVREGHAALHLLFEDDSRSKL